MNILLVRPAGWTPGARVAYLPSGHVHVEVASDGDPAALRDYRFRIVVLQEQMWRDVAEPMQDAITRAYLRDGKLNLTGVAGDQPDPTNPIPESPLPA